MNKIIVTLLFFVPLSCLAATQDEHCLALAIYSEASKTVLQDQRGVYQVIINRMHVSNKSACAIIKERKQFSFVSPKTKWVATQEMLNKLYKIRTMPKIFSNDILWFHTHFVKPPWSYKFKMVYDTGVHKYYRSE